MKTKIKIMRYFNVIQHSEPKSMFSGERKVNISELEKTAKEISEEQSKQIPHWGSGNISVDETGKWEWETTNHDTSD
jgi:UDP-glucose 4-epimerase